MSTNLRLALLVLALAAAGGWLGWARATWVMRRGPPLSRDLPDGMNRRDYHRLWRRRQRMRRYLMALLFAGLGVLVGLAFLMAITRH